MRRIQCWTRSPLDHLVRHHYRSMLQSGDVQITLNMRTRFIHIMVMDDAA